jgi:hypothetical protein
MAISSPSLFRYLKQSTIVRATPTLDEPRVQIRHRFVEARFEIGLDALKLILARLQILKRPCAVTRVDEISQSTFTFAHPFRPSRLLLLLNVAAIGHLDRKRQRQPARRRGAHAWKAAHNVAPQFLKSTNPTGWATLAAEINLAEANQDALTTCREAAQRTKKEQHCTIVVPAS